ncbi:MAG: dihydrolipoyl dehydrogenase family protein [Gammaproteobacteria bacterium]
MKKPEYDLCIIGGGAAGPVAAAGAATLGAKVILVEKHRLGGDCLLYGCVPSKTLLHCAKVAHTLRHADRYGIPAATPGISIATVMEHVQSVIETVALHDSPERFQELGVEVCFGSGSFVSPACFQVEQRSISARKFVIATGSRPAVPPIEGLDSVPYLTNETVFSLAEAVDHLIVLGGGPIGVELSQAFVRLGCQVTLMEMGGRILPREDEDMAQVVAAQLRADGIAFHFNSTVHRVVKTAQGILVHFKDAAEEHQQLPGSHLLVAAGRRSNVKDLGLEQAGVVLKQGRIKTDKRLRTSNRNIFACGDVVGPYQFTHMAEHQAGVVLRNALFHIPARVEERVIPWCTFSDPELARVGLSESEARQAGIRHQVYRFPFQDIDRAQAEGETAGCAKIITDPKGRLLGAALAGPHAGELIHEYALALARNMKAADLSKVIHIYPTLAQINRRVADQRLKAGLTPNAKKWLKRLFGLRGT